MARLGTLLSHINESDDDNEQDKYDTINEDDLEPIEPIKMKKQLSTALTVKIEDAVQLDEDQRKAGWSTDDLIESVERKMLRRDAQTSLVGAVVLLTACQLTAASALVYQLANFRMKPVSASIVVTRFICGLVFHIYLQAEFKQGYSLMSYALNHPWKFELPRLAFFVGFLQTFVVFAIELMTYVIVVGSNSYLDIVLGVLASFFIVTWSNFFFHQP